MRWLFLLLLLSGCEKEWVPYHVTCYSGGKIIWEKDVEWLKGSIGHHRDNVTHDDVSFPTDASCVFEKIGSSKTSDEE